MGVLQYTVGSRIHNDPISELLYGGEYNLPAVQSASSCFGVFVGSV